MSKFKVGDWWRTRDGEYVKITYIDGNRVYPIITSSGDSYGLNGMHSRIEETSVDLVQKMKTPAWEEDNE